MLRKNQFLSAKIFREDIEQVPTRNGYGEGLFELGKKNKNVVVLCCDLTESTRSETFAKAFPERFIEIGVAEQNMAGIASGIAMEGKIPFMSSYAVFSPGRNWDQIRVSVCYNNLNVKIAGAHAGVSVGPDGATHQALEDIAITRVLPRMTVVVPADAEETKKATIATAAFPGPVYLRFTRDKSPVFTTAKSPFKIGHAEILWEGKRPKIAIIACGPQVYEALHAAKMLERNGIESIVINNHTIKPLDKKTLLSVCRKVQGIVTVEEHQVNGGLFGAISEFYAQHHPLPVIPVAMPDCFGESGEPNELLAKYGLRGEDIVEKAMILSLKGNAT
jgi:transketolase